MPTHKRKTILHRVLKTENKIYNQPVVERETIRDIQVVFEPSKYNWFTAPISHPRWVYLVVLVILVALEFLY